MLSITTSQPANRSKWPSEMLAPANLNIQRLGRQPYREVWDAMRAFTADRSGATPDEIWLVEHPPVFTLGLNGKSEHLLAPGDIPVIEVDRGGQVTYHGPGQVVAYLLLDLRRRRMGVRDAVSLMEASILGVLENHGVLGTLRPNAPGVYVDDAKVAALGLRVRRGCCYHGLSLNIDMDLEPFARINPCGYSGQPVTQLADLGIDLTAEAAGEAVLDSLSRRLDATATPVSPAPASQE